MSPPTPEERARAKIDAMLAASGWTVVSRADYRADDPASAVTEGLMQGGTEADYLLFLDNRAVGVIEAKRAENDLGPEVAAQAEGYASHPLPWVSPLAVPLPFVFLSNGDKLLFRDLRAKGGAYETRERFPTPAEALALLGLGSAFGALPAFTPHERRALRACQTEAVSALERSFRRGDDRALVVLATGAGKTFTACTFCYRFLAHTPIRRVLFLVDRNNLGRQAHGEFGAFRLTASGEPFTSIYEVERLSADHATARASVVISTIQRLYAFLTHQALASGAAAEDAEDEAADPAAEDAAPAVAAPGADAALPPDHFDLVVVDECHRSIYGRWRAVLEYFKGARIVGLTATPDERTEEFFRGNVVAHYSFDRSVLDGVNVDGRTFDITTKINSEGGAVREGETVEELSRRTGHKISRVVEDGWDFTPSQLDRAVENEATVRLVLETYRDAVYTKLYPARKPDFSALPKTLVFAKSDRHADLIVRVARDVFAGQSPAFAQKITYSADDTEALLRAFRNDADFRLAVTVTLVATGTDVRPLEVLLFLRDVQSRTLFTQMRGRGVRAIGDDKLLAVTPNAVDGKRLFYLVDAVGVTHHDLWLGPASARPPSPNPPFHLLLECIAHGDLTDDNLRLLAARLSRTHHKSTEPQRADFSALCGYTLFELAEGIVRFLERDDRAPFAPGGPNTARWPLVAPLANNPDAREKLLDLWAGVLTVRLPGEDELVYAGFSRDEAQGAVSAFQRALREHADRIEALRILSQNPAAPAPITREALVDLRDRLLSLDPRFAAPTLWNAYRTLAPESVEDLRRDERDLLTNLVALVRHAFGGFPRLVPFPRLAAQRFNLWCGQPQNALSEPQKRILREVTAYLAANGEIPEPDLRGAFDLTFRAQALAAFGTPAALSSALRAYAAFLLAG